MAYIKTCNFCGQKISMREMRHGQWVAFDASTETPHKCGYQTEPDPNIRILAKEKIKEQDSEGIDLGYSDKEVYRPSEDQIDEMAEAILKKEKVPEDMIDREKGGIWIDERARVPESLKQDYSSNSENKKDFSFKNHSYPEWLSVLIWVVIIVAIFYFNLN